MSQKKKLLRDAKNNPKGVRFDDLCKLAEYFGFVLKGGGGSHCVYSRPETKTIMNFQSVKGMAQAYQVRQLLKFIRENELDKEQ